MSVRSALRLGGLTAAACVIGVLAAPRAEAVSGSAAISAVILPPDSATLVLHDLFDVRLRVKNDCLDDNLSDLPATLKAGAKIIVTLACEDSTCAAPLPGTLDFTPVPAIGCANANAGVSICSASGANSVEILIGSDITLAPASLTDIAEIRLDPAVPLPPPGSFTMVASTEAIANIQCCSLVTPGACANAQAQGTIPMTFPEVCGDGIVNAPGETCDPPGSPAGASGNICRVDCTVCGDAIVDSGDGEQCDDGNNVNGDGCDNDCTISAPYCGDGVVNAPGETCDPPGSPAGGNGNLCREDCTVCGDKIVDSGDGEQCDDGNGIDDDACRNNCTIGNTIVRPCLHPCASRLVFGSGPRPDILDAHLRVPTSPGCDPAANPFSFSLTNAGGTVFSATLPVGGLEQRGAAWVFRDNAARLGGGLGFVKVARRKDLPGGIRVDIRGFGDFQSTATVADMTMNVTVCGTSAATTNTWTSLGSRGWQVNLPL